MSILRDWGALNPLPPRDWGPLAGTPEDDLDANQTITGGEILVSIIGPSHTHDGTGTRSTVVGGVGEAGTGVPVANNAGSAAFGDFADGSGVRGLAIGTGDSTTSGPLATGTDAIAIGSGITGSIGPQASGTSAIAIGHRANAAGANAVCVGAANGSVAGPSVTTATDCIAIGAGITLVSGNDASIMIGLSASRGSATVGNLIAIGQLATASASRAIAIGTNALSSNTDTIAIGGATTQATAANATGASAIAIGADSLSEGGSSIAIGAAATATTGSNGNIALGRSSNADGTSNIAIGDAAQATTSTGVIAIGGFNNNSTSSAGATGAAAIAIGNSRLTTVTGTRSSGAASIAIGGGSNTAGGVGASATAANAIAIGGANAGNPAAAASAADAIAIGQGSISSIADGIAIGRASVASTGTKAVAIGQGATTAHASAVSLGTGATTTKANQFMLGTSAEVVTHPGGVEYRINLQTGTTYTATRQDAIVVGNNATGLTVTLPLAVGSGQRLVIKNINATNLTVATDATGTQDKMDGSTANVTLAQYELLEIVDRATDEWIKLHQGAP